MTIAQNYPAGVDLVWIARDQYGHLAAFVTAGAGQIPEAVLGGDDQPSVDYENEILNLPVISDVLLHVQVPRPDDFVAMAERGFFVFDWCDLHRRFREASGCYELVASPGTCLNANFDNEMLGSVLLPGVDFSATKMICLRDAIGFIEPAQ